MDMNKWKEKKDLKLRQYKDAKEQNSGYNFKPDINPIS